MSFSFRRGNKQEDVIVDRLTGAFNRRQLDVDIAAGIDTSGHSTATLMIEVDEFASYNGKNGNAKGDQVLERVAWVIMATVRTTDVVYRHEASTFCVLLPSTPDDDAIAVADRIRANVAKMPLLADCGVSISVGVASGPADDVRDAVDRAVQALDEAVRTGQPRILNGMNGCKTPGSSNKKPTPPPSVVVENTTAPPAPAVPTLSAMAPPPPVKIEVPPGDPQRPLTPPSLP